MLPHSSFFRIKKAVISALFSIFLVLYTFSGAQQPAQAFCFFKKKQSVASLIQQAEQLTQEGWKLNDYDELDKGAILYKKAKKQAQTAEEYSIFSQALSQLSYGLGERSIQRWNDYEYALPDFEKALLVATYPTLEYAPNPNLNSEWILKIRSALIESYKKNKINPENIEELIKRARSLEEFHAHIQAVGAYLMALTLEPSSQSIQKNIEFNLTMIREGQLIFQYKKEKKESTVKIIQSAYRTQNHALAQTAKKLNTRINKFYQLYTDAFQPTGPVSLSGNIFCSIDEQGQLLGVRLRNSSKNPVFDDIMLASARAAAPFPPIPNMDHFALPGEHHIYLRLDFKYTKQNITGSYPIRYPYYRHF